MRRTLVLISILLLGLTGCGRQVVRRGRCDLTVIYIAELPADEQGWSDLAQAIAASGEDPLVVVDDKDFSNADDLAWWEGERAVIMLEELGCDIFLPPASWQLLGNSRLDELNSRAVFFMLAVDLVDREGRYPMSQYMIRHISPWRAAFAAPVNRLEDSPELADFTYLSRDSVLSVTSTFLAGMQVDFLFYFSDDDPPEGIYSIPRPDENYRADIRFVNPSEFKTKKSNFEPPSTEIIENNPYAVWQAKALSVDAEIIGAVDTVLTVDSLKHLAVNVIGSDVPEGSMIYLGDDFVKSSIGPGEVSVEMMREVLAPEIFVTVSAGDFVKIMGGQRSDLPDWVERAVVPVSLCVDQDVVIQSTGITSARVALKMLRDGGQ